jgi:hypothetical protein
LIAQTPTPDRSPKLAYTKPALEILGLVRELTLAGTGQANESAGSNNMCADVLYDVNLMCT